MTDKNLCDVCQLVGTEYCHYCEPQLMEMCQFAVHATKDEVASLTASKNALSTLSGQLAINNADILIERDELRKELAALKSKTRCAYCGEEFPLDTVTADQVEKHIFGCDKHPIWHLQRASNAMAREIRRHRKSTADVRDIVQEFIDTVQFTEEKFIDGETQEK